MIRVGFQINDIIIVIIRVSSTLIYCINLIPFIFTEHPVYYTANNHAAIHIGTYIDRCAAAAAFTLIGRLLLCRQTALINAAPWRRCGRIARRIGKTFNHQAAGNIRANINGDAVFAAHVNITPLAVIAANCAVNVNAASVVPAHTNQR